MEDTFTIIARCSRCGDRTYTTRTGRRLKDEGRNREVLCSPCFSDVAHQAHTNTEERCARCGSTNVNDWLCFDCEDAGDD